MKSFNIAIINFPGSNCVDDIFDVFDDIFDIKSEIIWHKEKSLPKKLDLIVLPGGFSYGDYLRAGALASHSNIIAEIKKFISKGGFCLGICNGFQILTESKILPGVVLANTDLKYHCKNTYLKVCGNASNYQKKFHGKIHKMPIAHGQGRYYADRNTVDRLFYQGQVVFQYSSFDGKVNDDFNPNGSCDNIAGISSKNGKVVAMMPHPERACDSHLVQKSTDGIDFIKSFLEDIF